MRLCCVLCSSAELRQKKLFSHRNPKTIVKSEKFVSNATIYDSLGATFIFLSFNGTSPVYHFSCFRGKGSFLKYFF